MANGTLLQLLQQVTNELGVPTPTVVVGNTSQDVIQLYALMNACGYELLRKADWQQRIKQNIFTTVYAESNGYTNTASLTNQTIYGLDSSVAAVDSTYQVVGTGISNATYVDSVVESGGVYNVTVSQPITQTTGTSSTPITTTGSYDSSTMSPNEIVVPAGLLGQIAEGCTFSIDSPATTGTVTSVDGLGVDGLHLFLSVSPAFPATATFNVTFSNLAAYSTFNFQKVKYDMPSDYDSTIPRTHWDKSKRWEMLGPEDAQQWEWLLSGYISTGPRIRWRIFQNLFQIWPGNSTGERLGFEYLSKAWVLSAAGASKNSFTADTDTCIYPDRLMVLMCKLKYFEGKGFDTTAMYRNFRDELETCIAQNTSSANLSFAPRPGTVLIGYDNLPDTGYGAEH